MDPDGPLVGLPALPPLAGQLAQLAPITQLGGRLPDESFTGNTTAAGLSNDSSFGIDTTPWNVNNPQLSAFHTLAWSVTTGVGGSRVRVRFVAQPCPGLTDPAHGGVDRKTVRIRGYDCFLELLIRPRASLPLCSPSTGLRVVVVRLGLGSLGYGTESIP